MYTTAAATRRAYAPLSVCVKRGFPVKLGQFDKMHLQKKKPPDGPSTTPMNTNIRAIRFNGTLPEPSDSTPQGRMKRALSAVDETGKSAAEAFQEFFADETAGAGQIYINKDTKKYKSLLRMSAPFLPKAVEQLQVNATLEAANGFLMLADWQTAALTSNLDSVRLHGWRQLFELVTGEGSAAAKNWQEGDMKLLKEAVKSAKPAEVPVAREIVYAVATQAQIPMPRERRDQESYVVTERDRMVGDLLDKLWELAGKTDSRDLDADIARAIDLAPRTVLWLRADPAKGPLMSRELSERARALMGRGDPCYQAHVNSVPLDWLEPEEARSVLASQPLNLHRLAEYKGADPALTRAAVERLFALDWDR